MKSSQFIQIFNQSISDYHVVDDVDSPINNPYPNHSFEHILYTKNWIDTVQWHLEDIIRNPNIDAQEALTIKRRIDKSNQDRTDMVEQIDDYFFEQFKNIQASENAKINTETLGWAIDRLSILCLKIYHMRSETSRKEASQDHIQKCQERLSILLVQEQDMINSINELHQDIAQGIKKMRLYKQMKMYNDPALNPVLYAKKA